MMVKEQFSRFGGARIAVSLSLMHEGGLPANAFFEHGVQGDVPRVLDGIGRHGIKLTSDTIGEAVSKLLALAREIEAMPIIRWDSPTKTGLPDPERELC